MQYFGKHLIIFLNVTYVAIVHQFNIDGNITPREKNYFYHGHDVSRAMVMWPPLRGVTHLSLNRQEQTRLQGLHLE